MAISGRHFQFVQGADKNVKTDCVCSGGHCAAVGGFAALRMRRQEFPYLKTKMPTLWTNSYFVSTVGGAPLEAVKQYIENQKTSQRQKDKMG